MAVMWAAYALLRAGIHLSQKRLARRHEAHDRLLCVLQPLLGGGGGGARWAVREGRGGGGA